jgi:CHAT domain-containing protein
MPGDLRKHAAEAFRQMEQGALHPRMEEIAAYVRGNLAEDRRTGIEAHLAGCADCRGRGSEFEMFLADCEHPEALPRNEVNQEFDRLQRRIDPGKVVRMPQRWLAIAAAVIVAVGAAATTYRWLMSSTPQLLAQAYREHRTSEFRLAGADYAELRQERAGGSAFSLPASLLKAQARIQEELKSRGADPDLLRMKGEAQIIGGDAAGAVETLRKAHELRSDDAAILADLGAAYGLLGDVEHDFDKYKEAVDSLDESQRLDPENVEVMFNRAVVLEKLLLYPEAVVAWKEYLKADSSSDWTGEARRRLAAVEQKIEQREKKVGQVRDDPAGFLKLADADAVDEEAWLISPVSSAWLVRSRSDAGAQRAVTKLAEILARKHGDTWLRDMAAGGCASPEAAAALGRLLSADTQATEGRYEVALAAAKEGAGSFMKAGCTPGVLQARLSQLSAVESLGRLQECLETATQLSRELEPLTYIRLRARVAKEYGLCAMRSGLLDEADAAIRRALQLAGGATYGATHLDLWNIGLDKTTYSGLPTQIIAGAAESLRIFWSGAYSRNLAYFPLYELRAYAARSGQKNAALDFAHAAVWAMSGEGASARIRMGAYMNLAVAEREIGDLRAAQKDFETSDRIAAQLPPRYRAVPATALARLDLQRGDAGAALDRLTPLGDAAPSLVWVDRAAYYTALGEALAAKRSFARAAAAFRTVIDSAAAPLAATRSDEERSGVLKGVESAYRGLVAAQLAAPGNEAAAFETWRSYRDFDSPHRDRVTPAADDPVLWYVELADGFVAWLSGASPPVFHRFTTSKDTVAAVARRFLKESSDPLTSHDALGADARQLYQWMLEPFEPRLGGATRLVFDLDGALAALPLQSLVSSDGRYVGDRFSVMVSAGRGEGSPVDPRPDARVLVVANPAIAGASASRFPPLPDSLREAEAIRASFPESTLLEGRAASVESLTRELPHADIVHFAGHGYSSSGYGALLLAPKDPATADFQLLRAAEMRGMDWSRCRLAVLSACAAAEGETHGAHNPDSLIRALTKAGARRIAASLWNVDSAASAELMAQFYSCIKSGKGPAEALRAAQQALRRNSRWRQPYYWAGFQLYGTT